MIGIWGIGGGGKTTLASSIYREISRKFYGCSFVDNIREKSSKYGLEKLQKKVLLDILKEKDTRVSRLCHKNVLIVLDDVDHLDQLNMLAGSHDWFGKGSRIIITTRDRHLLKAHNVNAIYDIRLLDDDEAIKLFRKHAPKQDCIPIEAYETFSKEVVSYAGGLPLALKVLGSFLCDKEINEWRSALKRLKDIPEDDIIGKLKISYDGLKQIEKELFLDIACFHRGEKIEDATIGLDASGLHPIIGIKVLIEKALITISKDEYNLSSQGWFDMHDLVQEMGHYIAQGDHPENPEKHSRIWREKEILSICSMNTTMNSDKIEALHLDTFMKDCPQHLPDIVATIKNLRSIYWKGYPASVLPTNFQLTKLRCLILRYGKQIQLWEGHKSLPNLKLLDLTNSRELIKTPDLSGLPCLERMLLCGCSNLREIHPSIGCHERLAFLDLDWCSSLEIFPPITRMPKLVTLILSWCMNLTKFPDIQTKMDSLEDICLRESAIKVLPSSILQYCTNLVSLDLSYCRSLGSIEVDFCRFKKLKELQLPRFLTTIKSPQNSYFLRFPHLPRFLTRLSLRSCNLFDGDIPSHIYELSSLQVLDLRYNNISRIPFNLLQFPRLRFLNISHCRSLVELPDLPSCISVLDAYGCDSLNIRGDFLTNYKWLWKVTLGRNVCGGENVLRSMIQGNATAGHFMSFWKDGGFDTSVGLGFEISTTTFASETFILQLPLNWYRDYSGFLICVAQSGLFAEYILSDVMIIIKHTDDQTCLLSDDFERTEIKRMCYIPFSSLMHRPLWNGNISFFITECRFKVELVPRRREGGSTETSTDSSEFWDEEYIDKKTFTIEHASETSIEVTWLY